jgi:hypothetical protein
MARNKVKTCLKSKPPSFMDLHNVKPGNQTTSNSVHNGDIIQSESRATETYLMVTVVSGRRNETLRDCWEQGAEENVWVLRDSKDQHDRENYIIRTFVVYVRHWM